MLLKGKPVSSLPLPSSDCSALLSNLSRIPATYVILNFPVATLKKKSKKQKASVTHLILFYLTQYI